MQLVVVTDRQTAGLVQPAEEPADLGAGQNVFGDGPDQFRCRCIGGDGGGHDRCTFPARPSRNARILVWASVLLPATAAINDSSRYPSSGLAWVIRGSACRTAKFVTGEFPATFPASSSAFARPSPGPVR